MEIEKIENFRTPVSFLLTDIDDTLTDQGRLGPEAYEGLWELSRRGIGVIPVTGRPAGWCEMIARQWPVAGVVGENGAFYFRYHHGKMRRRFSSDEATRLKNQSKLEELRSEILHEVPGAAVASDQFCRLFDLAIDFCEDVPPLPKPYVEKIVSLFHQGGAQAKVSSIHVNGWFGNHNKLSQSLDFLREEFGLSPSMAQTQCAFIGDSPNDEPLWEFFPHGLAVANIQKFIGDLHHYPRFITQNPGGRGFAEAVKRINSNFQSVHSWNPLNIPKPSGKS